MTSSPPPTDTRITTSGTSVPHIHPLINPSRMLVPPIHPPVNPSGTTDPLASSPALVTFNTPATQHAGTSSQNPLGIHWPPMTTPGINLLLTEPMHHPGRSLPFVPLFPEPHTPNINTINQTLNFTPSSKEIMRKNIQMQIVLMQQ